MTSQTYKAITTSLIMMFLFNVVIAEPEAPRPIREAFQEEISSIIQSDAEYDEVMIKLNAFMNKMLVDYSSSEIYKVIWNINQTSDYEAQWEEWVWEWMILRSTQGDLSGKRFPFSSTILLNNIYWTCHRQGKSFECAKWAHFAQRLLETQHGIVFDHSQYVDQADPIHPAFTNIPLKKFPLTYDTQLNTPEDNTRGSQTIEFYHLAAMQILGYEARAKGDLKTYLYLNDWIRQVVEEKQKEFNTINKHVKQEYLSKNAYANLAFSSQLQLQGDFKASLLHLQTRLTDYPANYYGHTEQDRIRSIYLKAQLGQLAEEDITWLEANRTELPKNKYIEADISHLNLRTIIWWYALAGKSEKADLVLAEYYDKNGYDSEILKLIIELVMRNQDTRTEINHVFWKTLEDQRQRGDLMEQPFLYEDYAKWLLLNNRKQDALLIQKNAILSFLGLEMTEMKQRAELRLASYLRLPEIQNEPPIAHPHIFDLPLTEDEIKVASMPYDTMSRQYDLQPAIISVRAMDNIAGPSTFLLSNPTESALKGRLSLSSGRVVKKENNHDSLSLWLRFDTDLKDETIPLDLFPLSTKQIQILAADISEQRSLKLTWTPYGADQKIKTAELVMSPNQSFINGSITQINAFSENPFLSQRLHHTVTVRNTYKPFETFFKITSSVPSYIEVYDGENGRLLFIDQNGNGSLKDHGDIFKQNDGLSEYPMLHIPENRNYATHWINISPLDPMTAESATLTFEIESLTGAWIPYSVHHIEVDPGEPNIEAKSPF